MATNNSVNSPLAGTTGSGNFVGSTSAVLTTPDLGTPSALVLTNATGSQKGLTNATTPGAGQVGEIISSVTTNGGGSITLSNNTPANITSITLTAGNWLILGKQNGTFGAVISNMFLAISTTTNSLGTDVVASVGGSNLAPITLNNWAFVSINSSTTYYLVASSAFAGAAPVVWGSIYGIRMP